ncbi:MAG: DUF1918 domain-containing protein [Streptosporangiaceae bacterium]
MKRASMRAQVGDRLIVAGNPDRTGIVIDVPGPGGCPPHVIKWLSEGHIAMVFPDEYAIIVPADSARSDSAS